MTPVEVLAVMDDAADTLDDLGRVGRADRLWKARDEVFRIIAERDQLRDSLADLIPHAIARDIPTPQTPEPMEPQS